MSGNNQRNNCNQYDGKYLPRPKVSLQDEGADADGGAGKAANNHGP